MVTCIDFVWELENPKSSVWKIAFDFFWASNSNYTCCEEPVCEIINNNNNNNNNNNSNNNNNKNDDNDTSDHPMHKSVHIYKRNNKKTSKKQEISS